MHNLSGLVDDAYARDDRKVQRRLGYLELLVREAPATFNSGLGGESHLIQEIHCLSCRNLLQQGSKNDFQLLVDALLLRVADERLPVQRLVLDASLPVDSLNGGSTYLQLWELPVEKLRSPEERERQPLRQRVLAGEELDVLLRQLPGPRLCLP